MAIFVACLIGLQAVTQLDPLPHVRTLSEPLDGPGRIAVAADGSAVVADAYRDQIAKFDSSGVLVGTWPVPEGPVGVTVHPDGRVFVSRRDDARVGVYDADLVFQNFLADGVVTFVAPTDLAVDPSTGRVYVVDSGADKFYAFESDESLALVVGVRGSRSSEFKYPSAIAIDPVNDRIAVADQENCRIQLFTRSGIFVRRFGYRIKYLPGGLTEGWTPRTAGVAFDAAGRIYVVDAVMGTLRIFTASGAELGKVVDYGTGSGELQTPGDVAIDPWGRVYIVNSDRGAVEIYGAPVMTVASGSEGTFYQGTNGNEYDLFRWRRNAIRADSAGSAGLSDGSGKNDLLMDILGWDPPHMLDDLMCSRCHDIDGQPGGHLGLVEGQANLCRSCHTGAGQALVSVFRSSDVADPYGTNPDAADGRGRSHAWGVPATNTDADSIGPMPGGEMGLYLDAGSIKCATCHDQHNNDEGVPFLRISNDGDAMCKECHAPRNEGLGERGTHPVGFDYPGGVGEFPDGASIAPALLKDAMVECMTCHALHAADSGGANDGAGDGMLLRGASDGTFCQLCHTEHAIHDVRGGWQPTCTDCHDPHDPANENFTLVSRDIGGTPVTFEDNDLGSDGLTDFIHSNHTPSTFDGVCEVCHTSTGHHRNTSDGDHAHFTDSLCTECHPHDNGFLPSGGSCTSCHGQPPDGAAPPNTAGAHALHMSSPSGPGIATCYECHATFGDGNHNNGSTSFASGVDGNGDGNIDLSETDVCDACHGADGAFDGVNHPDVGAKANWATGVYNAGLLAAGKEEWCAGCHDDGTSMVLGVSAPPVAGDGTTWGYYTSGHGRSHAVPCSECHDLTAPHFDGVANTYVAASGNYQAAFRLKSIGGGPPLVVPRTGFDWEDAYNDPPYWELCFTCHDRYALLGGPTAPAGDYYSVEFKTNFRSDASLIIPDGLDTDIAPYSMTLAMDFNAHYAHTAGPPHFYDSDGDGITDSYGTCVACHNVHGGASAAMVRDGRLLGMEPALNFSHVRYDRHDPTVGGCADPIVMTSDGPVPLMESHGGVMRSDAGPGNNGVCNFCHGSGGGTGDPEYIINCYDPDHVDYYREPVEVAFGCLNCHSRAMDNGDGVPVGGRRPVVPDGGDPNDFGNTSHHIRGDVQNSDCLVCHDMSQHKQGHVRLKDVDSAVTVYDYDTATPEQKEAFCINCHDADGALAGPGTTPFSDGVTVPNVAGVPGSAWATSRHKLVSTRCSMCHGSNGHGSDNIKLLMAPAVDALCYVCHTEGMVQNDALSNNRPGGYISADDIQEAFAKSTTHNLGTTFDYGGDTFTLQCSTCHNPHVITGKYWEAPLNVTPITRPDFSDPVNNPRAMGTVVWGDSPGEKMDDFAAQGSGTGGWTYSTARGDNIIWDQPAVYQPPKAGNGYDFEFGGEMLPDYTTLCLDCHSQRMSAANPPVNWGQGIACTDNTVDPPNQRIECGAQHGLAPAGKPQYISDTGTAGFWGTSGNPDMVFAMNYVTRGRHNGHFMRWPYETADRAAGINFVMSCTDCHEAHGADRGGMIRERFNVNADGDCGAGGDPGTMGESCADGSNWNNMCNACHYYYGGQHAGMSCGNASCHEANSVHRIIHVTGSGAGTQLMLTAAGWESEYHRPDFTPEIDSVVGTVGGTDLTVTFRESQFGAGTSGIYADSGMTLGLAASDFRMFNGATNTERGIDSVTHTPGSTAATVTLTDPLAADDVYTDLLTLKEGSVWGWYEGGYNNAATGEIPAQVVAAGPWPTPVSTGFEITVVEAAWGGDKLWVEFSQAAYANDDGTGNLQVSDLVYTDVAGAASIITDLTHTAGDAFAVLTIDQALWTGGSGDIDQDTIGAAANAIFTVAGVYMSEEPVVITLGAEPRIMVAQGVEDHHKLAVWFSGRVYTNNDATGALQPGDLAFADAGAGKTIVSVDHTAGRPTATVTLDGDIVAGDIDAAVLSPVADSIYDILGTPMPTTALNDVRVTPGLVPAIASVEGVEGSNALEVTFESQVYGNDDETGDLGVGSLAYANNAAGGAASIAAISHTAGSPVVFVTLDAVLAAGDVGSDTIAVADGFVFGPSAGNFPADTAPAAIAAQAAPTIMIVEGAEGFDQVFVAFSEGVYAEADGTGALQSADFAYTDTAAGGASGIAGVVHTAGASTAIITLDAVLALGDITVDAIAAAGSQIYNSIGNAVGTGTALIATNGAPAWGTTFPIENEGPSSPAIWDSTGLLSGTVGNSAVALPLADNDWLECDEDLGTYVDVDNTASLMSPRALTVEARVRPTEVDRGVGDNTFNRIFQRSANFMVTILNTDYRGDDVPSHMGKASIEVKYRVASRHTCPQPQFPADPYVGTSVWNHQISSDFDAYPIVDGHWYLIRVVFDSDAADIAGSDGVPVHIFIDDQGADGLDAPNPTPADPTLNPDHQQWTGYANTTRRIGDSSSCKWGALPGDSLLLDYNRLSTIGAAPNHTQGFEGQIDWVSWKPLADYTGVDGFP